jgi:hypothetical protein
MQRASFSLKLNSLQNHGYNDTNPVERIKEVIDEYAIAKEGKSFGAYAMQIKSLLAIAPTEFRIELYQVYQEDAPIPDLYMVHVIISTKHNKGLYYTMSGKTYVRVDGLNKPLSGPQLEAEILKRFQP